MLLPGPPRRARRRAPRRGELDTRVPATGVGEIGQLGASFNAMAAALAAREDDLRVQTDRLQAILDHTTTTISVKDRDGRYLLVNDEWRRAMGQVGVDVIGRTDDELFPPDIAAAIRVTDLEILRTGEAAEYERDAATGGRAFQLVKFPLKDADGASTPPARWAPTSASASARWPRPSRPRARSPSSWPT